MGRTLTINERHAMLAGKADRSRLLREYLEDQRKQRYAKQEKARLKRLAKWDLEEARRQRKAARIAAGKRKPSDLRDRGFDPGRMPKPPHL